MKPAIVLVVGLVFFGGNAWTQEGLTPHPIDAGSTLHRADIFFGGSKSGIISNRAHTLSGSTP
jgi:hypothetical protein